MTERKLYTIVSEDDVFTRMVNLAVGYMQPIGGMINIKNMANLMHTSRYQIKKHMHSLRDKGLVELACISIPDEEELYPPYWGYKLTDAARETEFYKIRSEQELRVFRECFEEDKT